MTAHVVHGGVTPAELAEAAAHGLSLCDLSASLNPYGPHPRVAAAASNAAIWRYPEAAAESVRAAYASSRGLDVSQVLAGNGSSELIYLVAAAFARGETCIVVSPTFGEYAAATRAAGSAVDEFHWFDPGTAIPGVDALVERIHRLRPTLTFLCNPNNPTGHLVSAAEIERLTQAAAGNGGRLVVDEAYMDFAWPEDASVGPASARLVVGSLTKLHAIPGLRAGFLLGSPDDIGEVARRQPPWSLSAPASAAVLQALDEPEFARESQRKVAATRAILSEALTAAGFAVSRSHANFLLVEVGAAPAFRSCLLVRGFVVRDCTSFGLPSHIRIAIPHEDHVAGLIAAIKEVRLR